ncbi:secretion protein [Roseateles amylovorans]|uniref:Secretion protein n=1 Tax=Roseateles amylovorans TaxID=2978473 RepID=A0ABY6B241_9BURK|nr:secretion protein [Roseateles amylovorans]UXH78276.1 secretion protein [Roseateles amylovorans]
MKQLRILTGLHAGAQLLLTRRHYRIASDEEADLQISDWDQPALILMFDEAVDPMGDHEGSAVSLALHVSGNDGQPASPLGRLVDFMPRRFGDIVLCAGPDGAAWPSDMTLMQALMAPPPVQAPRQSASTRMKVGAVVCVAALTAGLAIVVSTQTVASATATAPIRPLERVQRALSTAGVLGLTVRQIDRRVVVEGLLPDSAATARVRAALQPFGEDQLLHRYAAASDLVRQIGDALNQPGLRVSYRGQGVFAVEGQSPDPAQLQNEARRVATDIGPLVARIEVLATETLPTSRARVGAMLNDDGLQYVQTADGIKHLSLRTPVADTSSNTEPASAPVNPGVNPSPLGEP